MPRLATLALAAAAATLFVTGCKKTADNSMNYKSAINTYYSAHPACLWTDSHQFPVQLDPKDDKARMYDALFDQHLLTRVAVEEKKSLKTFFTGQKQKNTYDLSDSGRSSWTADPSQPGFGNFCYGTRSVSSLDSSTPNDGKVGDTTVATYHWTLSSAPEWAKAQEVQTAFPSVATNLAGGGPETQTLIDTNNGWQVQPK